MTRFIAIAAVLCACTPAGSGKVDGTNPSKTTPPTGTATGTATGSTTTPTTGDCSTDPTLTVDDFSIAPGPMSTAVELSVTLSASAFAAVQCVDDANPDEILFQESDAEGTEHTFQMLGMTPNTDYTCSAVPTCPTMAGPAATLSHATGQPQSDLRPLTVTVDPTLGMEGTWTLAPFSVSAFGGQTYLVIWDPDGRVRWWHALPPSVGMWVEARWHADRGEIVWGGGMSEEGRMRAVDLWDGETLAYAPVGWQQDWFHHDGKQLDDGRWMTLEIRENTDGADTWDGFGVRVWDPVTDVTDVDFDSQTLFDQGALGPPSTPFDNDPWHANWVDWNDASDGPEIVVSLCLSHQIASFDPNTGLAKWVLGSGEGWTVLDETGAPLGEDALPQCQHGLEIDANRTMLVYDNGETRGQSALQEWSVDPATMTVQRHWQWTEPGFYEPFLGDIDHIANDRYLATAATMFGVSELIEVDRPTGLVASRMSLDAGGATYRSERYDGCTFFDSVRYCDDVAERHAEVQHLF